MRILLTNDDGINARGLHALINSIGSWAELYVAAPDRERSGTGHSITVFDPIKVVKTNITGVKAAWTIAGTPVDCVKLALARLITEEIDLVVSGINHGPNLGTDVLYSGTVSAAAESVIMGCPAIAVSLNSYYDDMNFDFAAEFINKFLLGTGKNGLEKQSILNINIPKHSPEKVKGLRITRLGVRNYENLFEERFDPRGNTYYWLGGGILTDNQEQDSDVQAIQSDYISITPINLDLTDYRLIEKYRQMFPPDLTLENIMKDHG